MKTYYLSEHSIFCKCHQSNRGKIIEEINNTEDENIRFYKSFSLQCERNPERLLFYHNNDFYLLVYNGCITSDRYSFLCDILKNAFQSKSKKYLSISKSNVYEKIEKCINENKYLKNIFSEINYIYYDSTGKKYCVESIIPIEHFNFDNDLLKENYIIAKNELINNGNDYLINELTQLYYDNCNINVNDRYVFKTTNLLINELNKQIKNYAN